MCIEIHSTMCNGITQEQFTLRGIRTELINQVQEPDSIKLLGIYHKLGVFAEQLGFNEPEVIVRGAR